MLFENNLTFLVLKIMVTYAGTMAMMFSTTNLKVVRKKAVIIAIISGYAVFTVLSTYLILILFGWEQLLRVFILTISCPTVLLLYTVSDEPFAKLSFSHATHILVSLYIAITVTLINTALHGTALSDILLRIIFYLPVVLFDFYFMRHIWLDFVRMVKKGWGVLALIPCAFIILFLTTALYPEHYTKRPISILMLYLLGVVIITVYLSIGSYLSMQYGRLQAEQNRALLELQVENIRRENADIEALAKQTKIIRHDLRHVLSTIASLAESGDTQAILDFIENTDGLSHAIPKPLHYCGDPILNATLTGYLASAKEMGIALETSLSIPDTLPVDCAELAVCFANMIETTIHICEKLPEKEKKLTVRCSHSPRLMFEIACPIQGKMKFDKKRLPTLPDGSLIGSAHSIAAFCDRHGADCSFKAESGWFQIIVIL
ncbi:MAG: hypothetical protein ACI32N_09820 [Bulleidia sp.]